MNRQNIINGQLLEIWHRFIQDKRVNCYHLGLMASYIYLSEIQGSTEISVTRRTMMALSHIRSYATYHKCTNELVRFGYIVYDPTYNPFIGSRISINL